MVHADALAQKLRQIFAKGGGEAKGAKLGGNGLLFLWCDDL